MDGLDARDIFFSPCLALDVRLAVFILPHQACITWQAIRMCGVFSFFKCSKSTRSAAGAYEILLCMHKKKPLVHYCIQIHACIITYQSKILHCAISFVQWE